MGAGADREPLTQGRRSDASKGRSPRQCSARPWRTRCAPATVIAPTADGALAEARQASVRARGAVVTTCRWRRPKCHGMACDLTYRRRVPFLSAGCRSDYVLGTARNRLVESSSVAVRGSRSRLGPRSIRTCTAERYFLQHWRMNEPQRGEPCTFLPMHRVAVSPKPKERGTIVPRSSGPFPLDKFRAEICSAGEFSPPADC